VVYNDFTLPPGVKLIYNTTPVLGNLGYIAGNTVQLLQVNIAGTSNNISLGPVKNYVPEQIYFKAGTGLNVVEDLMCSIENQKIVLFYNGHTHTFYGLQGSSTSTVEVYTPFYSRSYSVNAYPNPFGGYYFTLTVNYPIIIVNEQEWAYGGVLYG
jgi:hypothetical protein